MVLHIFKLFIYILKTAGYQRDYTSKNGTTLCSIKNRGFRVNIDGSAVVFNGPESELGDYGYPRDFRDKSRPQAEFLTAELQKSKIPFFIRAYKGNTSDPEQYRDTLPDIFSMVRKGSWIIVDRTYVDENVSTGMGCPLPGRPAPPSAGQSLLG